MIHRSRYPEPIVPADSLPAYVLAHADRYGDRPALVDGLTGDTVTYAALPPAVATAAGRLRAQGAGPGAHVVLTAANQPAWAVALFAVLATGAAAVPLNPTFTPGELRKLGSLAAAAFVIGDDQAGPAAAEAFDGTGVPVVRLADVAPGVPAAAAEALAAGGALRHGATVVALPRFRLDHYLRAVTAHRATWLHLAPPLALALALLSEEAATADLSSVRHAVSGAAPLDPGVAARIEGRPTLVVPVNARARSSSNGGRPAPAAPVNGRCPR